MALVDIAIGPGNLWIAPKGEAYPTDPTTTPSGNWEDLGRFEEDGLTLEADINKTMVRSAQDLDPVAHFAQSREIRIAVRLLELTMENIKYVFGTDGTISTDAGPPATETWSPGDTSAEYALLIRDTYGYQKTYPQDIQIPVMTVNGAVSMPFNPGQARSVGLAMTAIKPATGETLTVINVTSLT